MDTFTTSPAVVANRARYLANLASSVPNLRHIRQFDGPHDGSTMLAHRDGDKIFVDLFIPHGISDADRKAITTHLNDVSPRVNFLKMDLGLFWTMTMEAN